MQTPDQAEVCEARVYSVISGPVNLEIIERALVEAYPDSRTRTYYSQAGSRELHFESEQFDFEAYNLGSESGADSSFNGIVHGEQQAVVDVVRQLIRTIEITGHSVAFEIYGARNEVLFEQQHENGKR